MKRNFTITKVLIAIIGLTLTSCSTWHYNNPRVSVDREKTKTIATVSNSQVELATITGPVAIDKSPVLLPNANYHKPYKSELVKINHTQKTALTNGNKTETKSIFKLFADHIKKQNKKTCKIEKAEKTAASGWVRIMIIFFVVGLILLLIGIFLSIFVFGPFWWLFYGFGALFILAGFILLILILLGLI